MSVENDIAEFVDRTPESALSLRQAERLVRDSLVRAAGAEPYPVVVSMHLKVDRDFDWQRFSWAVQQVSLAHLTLSSVFPRGADGRRYWSRTAGSPVELSDPADLAAGREARDAWLAGLAAQPLDLASGPLMRASYAWADADQQGYVCLQIEHMVFDGLSERVLLRELAAAYAAQASLPAPDGDQAYLAFVRRQWQEVDSQAGLARLAFWASRLPFGRVRPPFDVTGPEQASQDPAHRSYELGRDTTAGLRALARSCRATSSGVYAQAVLSTMGALVDDPQLGFVSPYGNRTRMAEFAAIGNFSDYLVLHTEWPRGRAVRERVVHAQREISASMDRHYPWSTLVRTLQPADFAQPDRRSHVSLNLVNDAENAAGDTTGFGPGVVVYRPETDGDRPPHPVTITIFEDVEATRIDLSAIGSGSVVIDQFGESLVAALLSDVKGMSDGV